MAALAAAAAASAALASVPSAKATWVFGTPAHFKKKTRTSRKSPRERAILPRVCGEGRRKAFRQN
jgi:hypothetical protein